MKHLYAFFALMFVSIFYLNAQINVSVGLQPLMIYHYNSDFYVLCKGVDANFDGNYDPDTDEPPSLWRNDPIGMGPLSASKIIEFPFGLNSFPVRALFDEEFLYLQTNGYIWKYNITNGSLVDSIEFEHTVYGFFIDNGLLYVSTRVTPPGSWSPEHNYVISIDLATKEAKDTIEAKMNVQMCQIFNEKLFVLNEGTGAEDSYVTVYDLSTKEEIKSYPAGSFGNYFEIRDNQLYVVSNGSHKVFRYALDIDETFEYEVGTTGWDGPRELVFNPEGTKFRVSAYDGNIYEFKTTENQPVITTNAGKIVEGMLWGNYYDNDVFVAALINNPDYSANDFVTIWVSPLASVKDLAQMIKVYPNPATSFIKIEANHLNFDDFSIVSLEGKIVKEGKLYSNTIELNEIGAGKFFVRLSNQKETVAIPITIVK